MDKKIMKNKHLFVTTALTCFVITVLTSCGSSKPTVYTRADEQNERLQELVQVGWQIHGTTRTLRGKLSEHYAKMDANPDLYEVIGTSTGCRSATVCRSAAFNAACVEMAVKMGQDLKGKTMRDMGIDEGVELPTEYNRFQEACISKFQGAVKGDLEESFALMRKGSDGLNSYEIYFLVDRQSARKRRTQAIKDALEESNLHKDYAKSVEKFINDEVE
ncbi:MULTISPECIES: hypothetical protein [Bacteroides]|jgi:hypothetical protein|uniref:hypothetical protein n=1 Tax=Bacteroides TaxID=816 RepID=UPI00117E115F|nr:MULTISPECIES: hypothetical protein [Bacteroides]